PGRVTFGPLIVPVARVFTNGKPVVRPVVWKTSFRRTSTAKFNVMVTRAIAPLPMLEREPLNWQAAGRTCAGSFTKHWNNRRGLPVGWSGKSNIFTGLNNHCANIEPGRACARRCARARADPSFNAFDA